MTKSEQAVYIKAKLNSPVDTLDKLWDIVDDIANLLIDMTRPPEKKKDTVDNSLKWQKFDEWYSLYPRKEAVGIARRAWDKLSEKGWDMAIEALKKQLKEDTYQINHPDKTKRPLPATYLNAERWKDLPQEKQHVKFPICAYCHKETGPCFITVGNLAYCNIQHRNASLQRKGDGE